MKTTKTTFKAKNLFFETPKFWRRLGNAFLVFATGFPMALGQFVIEPSLEKNLCATVGTIALTIKAVTVFFAKEAK